MCDVSGLTWKVFMLAVVGNWYVLFVVTNSSKEREGFTCWVLLLSRNSGFLICRKEWDTASGVKHLLPKSPTSWTWCLLMKLSSTCWDTLTQRIHIWGAANPHALHEESIHQPKVKVLCAVSCTCIIGTVFHMAVITRVSLDISKEFVNWWDDQKLTFSCFQHDEMCYI